MCRTNTPALNAGLMGSFSPMSQCECKCEHLSVSIGRVIDWQPIEGVLSLLPCEPKKDKQYKRMDGWINN